MATKTKNTKTKAKSKDNAIAINRALDQDAKIQDLKYRIEELEDLNSALEDTIADLRVDLEAKDNDLLDYEDRVQSLQERIYELEKSATKDEVLYSVYYTTEQEQADEVWLDTFDTKAEAQLALIGLFDAESEAFNDDVISARIEEEPEY